MLLLLQCLLYWSFQYVNAREIVISENGTDTPSCLEEHNSLVSCQSLVKVSEYVTSDKLNNVIIMINDTKYTLQGVANFSGVDNITITGKDYLSTEISCNNSNTSEAGLAFDRSKHISLKNFTISHCAANIATCASNRNINFTFIGNGTAIQIINCFQVNVSGIMVYRSISQGLTFLNTGSTVRVIDSYFINNTVSQSHWLGNGALQVILYEGKLANTNYTIANCKFMNNGNITAKLEMAIKKHNYIDSWYFERGGGIRILLLDHYCRYCKIALENNTLEGNYAVYGGGAFIYISGNTANNIIKILNTSFIANTVLADGGGLEIGYTTQRKTTAPSNNTCIILNSSFIRNAAKNGGGLYTYSSSIDFRNTRYVYNTLKCIKCRFERNFAQSGSAVSSTRGLFSRDKSKSINELGCYECIFKNNVVIFKSNVVGNNNGAFFISEVQVNFGGTTEFTENNGTALYLDSSSYLKAIAFFQSNSTVYFSRNSGYNGGAIVLSGYSALYVRSDRDSSSFYFQNNTAAFYSGAISALTSILVKDMNEETDLVKSCFLYLLDYSNVFFFFHNNTASIGYSDMYSTSLEHCNYSCILPPIPPSFEAECLGNFTFNGSAKSIATSPIRFEIEFQGLLLPGIEAPLTIVQYDEFGGDVSELFPFVARVQSSRKNAKVAYYHNNSVTVVGIPGDEGELLLESSTFTLIKRFNLTSCGPGFEFHNGTFTCTCSKNYDSMKCENGLSTIASNYWAGYINDMMPNNLLTGLCVAKLCNPNNCDHSQYCNLPLMPDGPALQEQICGDSRHGRLCGRCNDNTSVYYHSESYTCGNNTSCYYGIPIYIVSELLPVTIIFLIILLFNIRITSGAVYGFVFYVQILSQINITAFKTIHIENHFIRHLVNFFQIVIGVFSFEIQSGGFCIFQTDTIMNLLMIQYATLAYAFFLVLATILFMRMHSCYSCVKLCRRCGRRNIRGSVVDGLSAFLVLCYFQCAAITSRILTPSYIHGINHEWITTVPIFDGELDYLKRTHLLYALPAFLCIIFILIPPPTILILEPILTKLFSMDCFTSTATKWYYNKLRLKLMPFLDSFQACFKDEHRYFAGLYFLYRLLFITIASIIVQDPQYYYGLVISLFMLIIPLHAFIRPYEKKWHDLSEMSLFFIIVSLLIITFYNYAFNRANGTKLIILQLVLISLSIGYMIVYIIFKIYQRLCSLKIKMKKDTSVNHERERELNEASDSLPYRLLNDNNERNSYRTF